MNLVLLGLLALAQFSLIYASATCFPFLPLPNSTSCQSAQQHMIADLDARYPNQRLITRHQHQKGDYIVPRSYMAGEGEDQCVISVDVVDDGAYDIFMSLELAVVAQVVIFQCLGKMTEELLRGPGEMMVGPREVVVVKVGREEMVGSGLTLDRDDDKNKTVSEASGVSDATVER